MSTPPPDTIDHRSAAIDGLRAIAALSVLAFHAWLYSLPTARAGVRDTLGDQIVHEFRLGLVLFFVLSGFLLFRPWVRAARRTWAAMAFHSPRPSCAQLMRAMSMPQATSRRTRPKSPAASDGSVTMMRTARSAGAGPSSSSVWRSSSLRLL